MLFASAHALAVLLAAPAGGFLGALGGFPILILMFVAMYFLMVVPNQRKQKQWAAMLAAIKVGDKVTSTGGLRGSVIAIKDDAYVVKTQPDGIKLEFVKSSIAAVTTEESEASKS
ncbi:preprotein translocase subunit YajC [Granulicella cerasi]|uniref:Sec translocon accessory complex subunit YajC n=1 Tax=Granulicella cerasi TaxID=741063 RepID=A0ABW1ZAB6_9BACT|nr:preprotein translocase subunit YajC [Granulicella cerasi]